MWQRGPKAAVNTRPHQHARKHAKLGAIVCGSPKHSAVHSFGSMQCSGCGGRLASTNIVSLCGPALAPFFPTEKKQQNRKAKQVWERSYEVLTPHRKDIKGDRWQIKSIPINLNAASPGRYTEAFSGSQDKFTTFQLQTREHRLSETKFRLTKKCDYGHQPTPKRAAATPETNAGTVPLGCFWQLD